MDQLVISPEALSTANAYLANEMSLSATSRALGLEEHIISAQLKKKEVEKYVQAVLMDLGYNNSYKLHKTMDALIDKKLLELDELEMSSGKDILDILALKHKMRNDELRLQIEVEKAKVAGTQVNIQNNNYSSLLEKIMKVES